MAVAKVMISLPREFLAEIDHVAREEHRSRSELLREATRLYLQMRRAVPRDDPRIRQAVAVQDRLAAEDGAVDWDSTAELRRWRERR
ncbi:MAG: ribbon-helix-helix protein, CopG family [Anaerolineae bacterium]|nr:ribbon-helix-helix protein, CopG family [Anaerolineae bacterium]